MFAGVGRVLRASAGIRKATNWPLAGPSVLDQLKAVPPEQPADLLKVCKSRRAEMTAADCVHALMLLDQHSRKTHELEKLVLLSKQAEVTRAISKAAKECHLLRADQYSNFLLLLSNSFVCRDKAAMKQVTEHAAGLASQLSVDDVVDLYSSVQSCPDFTDLTIILAENALRRIDDMLDPGEELIELWRYASRKKLGLVKIMESIVEALDDRSIVLTSEQLSSLVVECGNLPSMYCVRVLSQLRPYIIQNLSSETSASALSDIVAMYSTSYETADADFWTLILRRLTSKLVECEPLDLLKAADGVASSGRLQKAEKGAFLAPLATAAIEKLLHFTVPQVADLAESFAKANCSHKVLFYAIRRSLSRSISYGNTVFETPKVLFALARLQQTNKEFLDVCLKQMASVGVSDMPAAHLPLVMFVMAQANLVYKTIPKGLLEDLLVVIVEKEKAIPTEDFRLIVGCFNKIGFHSRALEEHIIVRLGNDASTTFAITQRWREQKIAEKDKEIRRIIHATKDLRVKIKQSKKFVNEQEDKDLQDDLTVAIGTGVSLATSEKSQDIRDSDEINYLWPGSSGGHFSKAKVAKAKAAMAARGRVEVPNDNVLPRDNLEPAMADRIQYDSYTNAGG